MLVIIVILMVCLLLHKVGAVANKPRDGGLLSCDLRACTCLFGLDACACRTDLTRPPLQVCKPYDLSICSVMEQWSLIVTLLTLYLMLYLLDDDVSGLCWLCCAATQGGGVTWTGGCKECHVRA